MRSAFDETFDAVLKAKSDGAGRLGPTMRRGQETFLVESEARLDDVLDVARMDLCRAKAMGAGPRPNGAGHRTSSLALMGLAPGATDAEALGRRYILTQLLATTAGFWRSPSQAILYASAQEASHRTFRCGQGQHEMEVTTELVANFRSILGERYVATLNRERIHLPPASFLDFGTASLQGARDRLGGDFAMVVGTLVRERPTYRVAVLQAKWASENGTANVGEGQGGQLRELEGTGMGYYAFYPRAVDGRAFLATVRSAASVSADVHGGRGRPSYAVNAVLGSKLRSPPRIGDRY